MYSIQYIEPGYPPLICTTGCYMWFSEKPDHGVISLYANDRRAFKAILNHLNRKNHSSAYVARDETPGRKRSLPDLPEHYFVVPVVFDYLKPMPFVQST